MAFPFPQRPRRKHTAAERERVLQAADGICHLCKLKIEPGQRWDSSHVDIPHEHGGDEERPAHLRCHRIETSTVTIPLIAKVKRQRRFHNGALETIVKLPGGRGDRLKRKIGGEIAPRVDGAARERALRAERSFLDFTKLPIAARFVDEVRS